MKHATPRYAIRYTELIAIAPTSGHQFTATAHYLVNARRSAQNISRRFGVWEPVKVIRQSDGQTVATYHNGNEIGP